MNPYADFLAECIKNNLKDKSKKTNVEISASVYHPSFKSEMFNIGYKLGYFLTIMRGNNSLRDLYFYGNQASLRIDKDYVNLRGAYGPRLRYWIGCDQLQESIKANADVEKQEDFSKPEGVDQLRMVYDDLKNGMPVTYCSIFDPAIDFDDSSDIPNLTGITFYKEQDGKLPIYDTLNMSANFTEAIIDCEFACDWFFLNLLLRVMSSILNLKPGIIDISLYKVSQRSPDFTIKTFDIKSEHVELDKDLDEWLSNMTYLMDFEKHMKFSIDKISVEHYEVNLCHVCDKLITKFIDPITVRYWKDYGLSLLIYSLNKYGGERYKEYNLELYKKIENEFKIEIFDLLEDKNEKKF